MINSAMDILEKHPIRKSKVQKQAFREDVLEYAKSLGYESTVEKGDFGARNIVIGDPKAAKYLVGGHYDTPAGMFFPNLMTPCNFVPFILYQLAVLVLMMGFVAAAIGITAVLTESYMISTLAGYGVLLLFLGFMMFGPANKNNKNDNTSGTITVLEIAKHLPEEYRDKVCFILFDLEEAGLLGSASYASKYKKEIKNQILFNLDCVSDGDHIRMFPTKKLKKMAEINDIREISFQDSEKDIALHEKGFSYFPSDQANFPNAVGIAALHRNKRGWYYCDKIHTKKDLVFDEKNIALIRDAIVSYLSR